SRSLWICRHPVDSTTRVLSRATAQ
ncbi:hypothetical protein TGPRC2_294370C, partial [Toxoplasma gondii TgCatPRC2]